ncbi:MAG: hypothetical protein LBB16_04210 [Puniceicoccales bacterium]|jgi:hypothetical protein|nr:hypothetical protein [Puniceicoccales bacterium]
MNENGYFQIEDPEFHWLNKFTPEGGIIGFLDPVTKDFIRATNPEEIVHWDKWFDIRLAG